MFRAVWRGERGSVKTACRWTEVVAVVGWRRAEAAVSCDCGDCSAEEV